MTAQANGAGQEPAFASIADRIRRSVALMTPAERRVGRTLVAGYPVAGLSTVADLAGASGTSSATVVRLVQKLGYNGYPQFQSALRDELASRSSGPAYRIDHGDRTWTEPGTLGRMLDAATRVVSSVGDTIPGSEFDATVALLADPRRPVKLLGGRITGLLAEYLQHHLSRARKDVQMFPSRPRDRHSALLDVGRRDVLIVMDVKRYDADVAELARSAANRGATIVLFTDVLLSPISSFSHLVLPVRVDAPSPFDTTVAVLVLIEALATAVIAALGADAVRRMHDWDTIADATPAAAG
ncbi:MAG TPA: MurR/RpiR family transcriptional regulator [Mycobacteriales bacterium]|nr:MurR/RpiR family transcriptional regulator [Mycobacteriales bacterium]